MNPIRRIVGKLAHFYYMRNALRKEFKGSILMLHWIEDDENSNLGLYKITRSQFELFLNVINQKNVIRLENWEKENNFYAISIDDVPENFYKNAFPLLKKARLPFTIFVNISLLNTEGYISKQQLQEMASCDLCTVGSHGVSHDEYQKLNREDAVKDLMESKKILEEIIKKPVILFAFPYGSFYACGFRYKHLVTDVYKYGFGTVACNITKQKNLPDYFLPRINVTKNFIDNLLNETS